MMRSILVAALLFLPFQTLVFAEKLCADNNCCGRTTGGISYCDSSSGRYVCRNGDYSTCYCTRHAVMDLQEFMGCCLWNGGVKKIDKFGAIICQDNSVSEICTTQNPREKIVSW